MSDIEACVGVELSILPYLDGTVSPPTNDLVSDEVDTVYFISVSGKVCMKLVRLEGPDLREGSAIIYPKMSSCTFTVLSLLALTRSRESADHVRR